MEATVERFLDESLLDDFKSTPLHTLESVLEQRKEADERRTRISERAEQLMQEELAKERHEKEVRDLQAAITETAEPPPSRPTKAKGGGAATAAAPAVAKADNPFSIEASLTGAGKSKNLKPYVYNHTEFVTATDANRHLQGLRQENEMLRRCLQEPRKPGAFDSYLRAKTTY